MDLDEAVAALARLAPGHPGLRLLVVYGSRARAAAHAGSDWDLGYLADSCVDHLGLLAEATGVLGTDDVDLVDLERASALLRFTAAGDGRPVYERSPGDHLTFVEQAARFWCDVEPVVRRTHASMLAELPGR